ncbi:hypothetical protein D3228_15220 [Leucobacter luti]|nr:hypothetical protein [Leucobacter luti]
MPRELTVHITVPVGAHGTGSRYVVRHRNRLSPTECVRIAGVHLTGWERTLFDLARTEPFVVALACADAALRAEVRSGRGGRQIDATAWEAWRARLLDRAERLPRGRGIAAVRALAELADPRADSPLESVSRLRALQLGIEVEPQAEVLAEDGGSLFVDLLMREYGVFGECDGKSKYTDPALRGGQSAAEIVYAEKRRHDWIAGTQRWRGVRWGAAEVTTSAAFARFLTAHGVPVPGKPARRHSPSTARVLAHAG